MATAPAARHRLRSSSEQKDEIPGKTRETVNTYAELDTLVGSTHTPKRPCPLAVGAFLLGSLQLLCSALRIGR